MKQLFSILIILSFALEIQAQVSKNVNVTAGNLSKSFSDQEKKAITHLKITGSLNSSDFKIFQYELIKLERLDLSNVKIGCEEDMIESYFPDSKADNSQILPEFAFVGNETLKEIILPSSLKVIRNAAFSGCKNLELVELPSQLVELGESVFSGCLKLRKINVPSSIKLIKGSFRNCPANINVDLSNQFYSSLDGVLFDKEKILLIHCPLNKIDFTIPKSVASISEKAFYGCKQLESITIPKSVINIGEYAFGYCSNLKEIDLPGIKIIPKGCFEECTSLNSAVVSNSVLSIEDYAFNKCKSLKSFIIPNTVTSIGDRAFKECYNLTRITIPSSVIYLGESAFYNCEKLEVVIINAPLDNIKERTFFGCEMMQNITLPKTVKSINTGAFTSCSALTQIDIPPSLKSFGSASFLGCKKLKIITIPLNVETIGERAFEGCVSLEKIYAHPVMPVDLSKSRDVFKNVNTIKCELHIPRGNKRDYSLSNQWRDFIIQKELDFTN